MYEERPSRLPGAVVWRRTPEPEARDARVLPDGCMDLLWWRGEIVVAGPDTVAKVASIRPGDHLVGLRFPPGVAPVVLGIPAQELRDARVPLAALWPAREVRSAVDALAAAPGRALEALAADRLATTGGPDPAIAPIVARLRAGNTVAAVADEVGLSERQLHRRSLAAFGYGPKTLARILRMERALELARAGTPLATVAAVSGYADQAHLSREVQALAGVSLRTLSATA
ncbi:helix-turn-helix transcriptional regulator [Phytohabitans rumicis]|uniref:AraC family transcriptional regulator n=1 Tax=Phytohabitans rumicis TaxID=1076125 RepID=A0A6V8LC33_9ACTN|nr:helix-turn-helix transcriptional regulator [Phytohabitans rumicis]GFJ94752.1 AraC family transcriptional regulator [Phytohabitans rumicis]